MASLSHFFAFSRDAIAASSETLCASSFSRARKGRFARDCRSFSRYKAHKMPFHAILLLFFELKKPFRAILSYFLTLPSRKKADPRDTVTFLNLKHQFRAILSSFLTLLSTKVVAPCDTVAIFIIKRPFRAILSHVLAKKYRSVRYCRYF